MAASMRSVHSFGGMGRDWLGFTFGGSEREIIIGSGVRGETLAQQETFLTEQGLTAKMTIASGDFVALLAPTGAALANYLFNISGAE